MTDAERRLWSRLRNGQVLGHKFRRQMPIGRFIADFACVRAKLVVEVDGGRHAETIAADRLRTAFIENAGYLVIRFWNAEVMRDVDSVISQIVFVIEARSAATAARS
jgi:very-short-patch-repair endonuclease